MKILPIILFLAGLCSCMVAQPRKQLVTVPEQHPSFHDNLPQIIAFWSPACKTSVGTLKRLAALQQAYNGRLQVIAVTKDDGAAVSAEQQVHRASGIYFVNGDTTWSGRFPYLLVPHLVWISADGRVEAITSEAYLAAEYIPEFLAGKPLSWYQKEDAMGFSDSRPLLVNGNGGPDSAFLFRSLLTGHRPGLPAQLGWYRQGKLLRVAAYNMSITDLYTLALPGADTIPPARWVFDGAEPVRFRYPGHGNIDEWLRLNTYCYERTMPWRGNPAEPATVQPDLDAWFGLHSAIGPRQLACWVLGGSPPTAPAGSHRRGNLRAPGPKFLQGESLSALVNYLAKQPGIVPVIDETGYSGPVSLSLPDNLSDTAALRHALEAQGVSVRNAVRTLTAITLSASVAPNPEP